MNQKEFESRGIEVEHLDKDGEKVAALLAALPRVEAPANFDFHLNARIARGRGPQSTLVPFFKILAPLGLVLLITVAFLFYGSSPSNPDVAVVDTRAAETRSTIPPSPADSLTRPLNSQPSGTAVSGPGAGQAIEPARTAKVTPVRATTVRARRTVDKGTIMVQPRDGSVDLTQKTANVINPPGIDDRTSSDIPVREVLQMLGITAEFTGTGWKVRSSAANSVAQRAGVKADDVIEAIDGKPLTGASSFKGSLGRVLSVRRDGKQIEVTLVSR